MAKQGWDVPTLRSIFTLDHPDFVCDPVGVKMDETHFWINGSIATRDARSAGSFTRQLVHRNREWVAVHDSFRVRPEFRRRRIAFNHYRKALRSYAALGCYRVEMFAQEYGPFVWPQFGFRCRWPGDRNDIATMLDRLHRDSTGRSLDAIPDREFGKQSGDAMQRVSAEPVPASEIRVSREAIAAAEQVLGRSLRSDVPDLPPEPQREEG